MTRVPAITYVDVDAMGGRGKGVCEGLRVSSGRRLVVCLSLFQEYSYVRGLRLIKGANVSRVKARG